jgi:uncharacterized membrane protein YkoI
MKSFLFPVIAAGALLAGSASAASNATSANFHGHELAGQAKITLAAARDAALKARPGKIVDQELEKEAGGSGLRYSFDVKSHGKTIEVGIDAITGKVLENGAETPGKEAKEVVQERAEAKPSH